MPLGNICDVIGGQNSLMSGRKGRASPMESEDDLEFLLKAAASNKEKASHAACEKTVEKVVQQMELPNLPDAPSVSFPNRNFAPGEASPYNEKLGWRSTNKELIEVERLQYAESVLPDLREGAEVHRRVRQWAMENNIIRPGVVLFDMCSQIEEATRRLSGYQPIKRGLAFPCGCSINNCAAHYTPLANDKRTLKEDDVMKIDFGVNINGSIIDSAFTVCFDHKFDPLIQAAKDATNEGIRKSGIDARLDEIGDAINEVYDAASIEINGKHYDIKPVSNLMGHSLKPYLIHADKSIPICRGGSQERMEEGEMFALETFGTTGKGRVNDDTDFLSHYMMSQNPPTPRTPSQRRLLKILQENFSTLAFCPRFIDRANEKNYQIDLRRLLECHAVVGCPALSDIKGSYVAQFEHTFILLPTHKEVLSRGLDY